MRDRLSNTFDSSFLVISMVIGIFIAAFVCAKSTMTYSEPNNQVSSNCVAELKIDSRCVPTERYLISENVLPVEASDGDNLQCEWTEIESEADLDVIEDGSSTYDAAPEISETVGYIFIGDSRTHGMDLYLNIEDPESHIYVVAKDSQGYKWLMNDAMNQVYDIRNSDKDVDRWEYIMNLGVNDTHNVDKYIDWATSVDDAIVHYVSINPLDNDTNNEAVEEFNEKLQNSGLHFVDTYYYLCHIGYVSNDGIHYGKETYQEIYDFVMAEITRNI